MYYFIFNIKYRLNTINSTDIDFTEINKGQVTLFNGSTLLSELSNGPLIQVRIQYKIENDKLNANLG